MSSAHHQARRLARSGSQSFAGIFMSSMNNKHLATNGRKIGPSPSSQQYMTELTHHNTYVYIDII